MEKGISNCGKSVSEVTWVMQQKSIEAVIATSTERGDGSHSLLYVVLRLQVPVHATNLTFVNQNINAAKKSLRQKWIIFRAY